MAKKLLGNKIWLGKMLKERDLMEKRLRLGRKWLVFFFAMTAVLPLPGPRGMAQTLPTLPQATVDTAMPAITGTTYTLNVGGNLQARNITPSPSTAHTYTVSAYAAAGNNSAQATRMSATTQAASPSSINPYDSTLEPKCNDPAVIFCEDWDHDTYLDLVDLDLTWDWGVSDNAGYSPNSGVVCGGVGYNSPCALQVQIAQDQPGTIYPRHYFSEQGISWTYARFYIKFDSNFQFYPSQDGAEKIAYFEPVGGSNNWRVELGIGRKDSTDTGWWFYDINTHSEPSAHTCDSNPLCSVQPNTWYEVEMGVLPNTAKGIADGALKLWVNNQLLIDDSGLDLKKVAPDSASGQGFQDFWVSAYYGGPSVSHPTMSLWYDNIVISRQPIGPLGTTTPASPKSLRIRP